MRTTNYKQSVIVSRTIETTLFLYQTNIGFYACMCMFPNITLQLDKGYLSDNVFMLQLEKIVIYRSAAGIWSQRRGAVVQFLFTDKRFINLRRTFL